jgi:hypothetical protein
MRGEDQKQTAMLSHFTWRGNLTALGSGSSHEGAVLLRGKIESATGPDARLYKKAAAGQGVRPPRGRL